MNNHDPYQELSSPKNYYSKTEFPCRILFLLLASWMVFPVIIQANNLSPVPVLERPNNKTMFQSNVPVKFDGSNSYDPDNTNVINYYWWYVDGQLMASGPSKSTFTTTFTIPAGSTTRSVQVKLKVRDDENLTKTRTNTLTLYSTTYYLTDHLGSIRTTIDQFGNVTGYDDYYPFGLPMPGRSSNLGNPNDLNKFTGHERDNEGGLMIDYMLARNYDPEIGRFMSVDPRYDLYPSISPYAYVGNNPLNATDPTGEWINFVVGGIVGAVVEVGSQVAINYSKTGSFTDAIANIDGGDVATATVFGAATAGIGTLKNLAKGVKTGVTIAANITEGAVKAKSGSQPQEYGIGDALRDVASGIVGDAVSGIGKILSNSTQAGQRFAKVAKSQGSRARRVGSESAQKSANQAQAKLNNHQSMLGIAPGGVASGGTSYGINTVLNGGTNQAGSTTMQVQTNSGTSPAPNDNTRTVIEINQ